MENSRFPNKLRFFRQCCGYSQKKVARMLGLSDTSSLSRWESGVSFPSIVQVFRLARIYRTQPQDLFSELWIQLAEEYRMLSDEPFSSYS